MPDALQTTLLVAGYEGIAFPVAEHSVSRPNDSAKHRSYRRPGADIEPTGARELSGTLTVPLFNTPPLVAQYGNLYPDLYSRLVAKFRAVPLGQLTHPTLGAFTAHIDDAPEALDPNRRNGIVLTIHWSEHNAEAQVIPPSGAGVPQSAPEAVIAKAKEADAAMLKADPSLSWDPLADLYTLKLDALTAITPTYGQIVEAFRALTDAITYNLALSVFQPAEAFEAVTVLETLYASTQAAAGFFMPGAGLVRKYTVPIDMALWEVAQQVYGDPGLATLLAAENSVPDPSSVPAGTVLSVPPVA